MERCYRGVSNERTYSTGKRNVKKTLWSIIDHQNLADGWGSFPGKELAI